MNPPICEQDGDHATGSVEKFIGGFGWVREPERESVCHSCGHDEKKNLVMRSNLWIIVVKKSRLENSSRVMECSETRHLGGKQILLGGDYREREERKKRKRIKS
ncbi:hypothetical protein CEXT_214691 [Caerostris extrusa]|uniref:Uncharacterized protein n=1 Tax=Caerostris extrusa TaxID=172846 RepID=A0AAV4PFV9_CAEEX|nr:hypothetical protein CEXT_214691 [Caerostris extrusa]